MPDEKQEDTNKPFDFKEFLLWATAYGAAACALYLYGYWRSFDINVLQYLSLSDIVSVGAYPALKSVSTAVGINSLALIFLSNSSALQGESISRKFELSFLRWITTGCMVLVTIIWFALPPKSNTILHSKWTILAAIVGLLLGQIAQYFSILKRFFKDTYSYSVVLSTLSVILTYSLADGIIESESILHSYKYSFITTELFKEKAKFHKQQRLKYLGAAGDYLFLGVTHLG